ncbi:MAG: hypothetical protein AAFY17_17220, partial [Cyanobacteria bacterium J06642_11]
MSAQTQALANLMMDALASRQGRLFGLFKKRPSYQTEHAVVGATQAYVRKFKERHGKLKILGMNKPVTLDSVYVPLQLVDNNQLDNIMSIDDMEKARRTRRDPGIKSAQKQQKTITDIANETQ